MSGRCFGVDVGGTSVKIGLFDTEGTLLEKWEISSRTENGGRAILPDIAASLKAKMQGLHLTREDIRGVGIGVPGPVLRDGTVEVCVNLGWGKTDITGEMAALLPGIPVIPGNDANVAALGEVWKGAGQGHDSAVMITLGTGIGGGIVVGGRIISGAHGMGGEIGHIHVRDDVEEACNCGGHGCLEQCASATGIVREARWVLAQNPQEKSMLREDEAHLSAKRVVECAAAGDLLAVKTLETSLYYLGRAMAGIAMVVDPEIFIIGGGVSRAGRLITDQIERYYRRFSPLSEQKSEIVLASLGNDAGMYGAAKLILSL